MYQPAGTKIEYQTTKPSGAHHGTTPWSDLGASDPLSFHLLLDPQVYAVFGDLSIWLLRTSAENATAGHVGGLRVAPRLTGGLDHGWGLSGI